MPTSGAIQSRAQYDDAFLRAHALSGTCNDVFFRVVIISDTCNDAFLRAPAISGTCNDTFLRAHAVSSICNALLRAHAMMHFFEPKSISCTCDDAIL